MWRVSTTSAQRHTQHASSTRNATYEFLLEIDALARLKVVEYACGCNSDAPVHAMTLLETLRDLPPHSLAHASFITLLFMRVLFCSPPVKAIITTTPLLNSPRQLSSRCCCPSAPRQSNDRPHQSNRCCTASHAVTRATNPQHNIKFRSAPHACIIPLHHVTPPPRAPLTCPCLPIRSSSGA